MPTSLQIVFHQTVNNLTTESNHSFWYDLSKDFILPFVLGGLAALMAYYIFIRETKRDKKMEKDRRDSERLDKLAYFSSLVESAFRSSVQQKNNLKDYIREMRKDEIEFHLMSQVPLYDLKRITENLDLEEYLLAYTKQYSDDRQKAVKEFKDIISAIDFLYEIFNHLTGTIEKAQKFDYERKLKLKGFSDRAYNLAGYLVEPIRDLDPAVGASLVVLVNTFRVNHPGDNSDLKFYNDFLFVPFNDFATQYIASGKPLPPEIYELAVLTRDGKQVLQEIKAQNKHSKEQYIADLKNIYRTLLDLRANSKRLLKDH